MRNLDFYNLIFFFMLCKGCMKILYLAGRYRYHRLNCLICCNLYCDYGLQEVDSNAKGNKRWAVIFGWFKNSTKTKNLQTKRQTKADRWHTGEVNRLWGKDFRDTTIIYIHEGHQGNWTKEGSEMEMKPLRLKHKEIITICKTQDTNECENKTGTNYQRQS